MLGYASNQSPVGTCTSVLSNAACQAAARRRGMVMPDGAECVGAPIAV
jgi:hypothetical protein